MADEAEQLQILIAALFCTQTRQAPTVGHQSGRRSVFQATINVVANVEHEHIMAKRRCAKQFNLRFADFFHISEQAVFIKRQGLTADDDGMWEACGLKRVLAEQAQGKRMVYCFPIRSGLKAVGGGLRHRARHLPLLLTPPFAQINVDVIRLVLAAIQPREQAGAIKKRTLFVQITGAHRPIVGIHLILKAILATSGL